MWVNLKSRNTNFSGWEKLKGDGLWERREKVRIQTLRLKKKVKKYERLIDRSVKSTRRKSPKSLNWKFYYNSIIWFF